MNNNKQDAGALEAHCKGVFQKTGYITIGSAEEPLGLIPKEPLPERWRAKQFGTVAPKSGKTMDVYFDTKHAYLAENDKYVDKWRYLDAGQKKKKGFGTSDFSRRDEFSNTVRTLQWREQLAHEGKWTQQAINFFNEAAAQTGGNQPQQQQQPQDEVLLFDLVYEKVQDHRLPACSKVHRDTKNRTMHSRERHLGGQLTTHALMFAPPDSFEKPEFARKPLIRDGFYRKTNIMFPPGCDATTAS